MAEITLYSYLAYGSDKTKKDVIDIMRSRGYVINPVTDADLEYCITKFIEHAGEPGLMDLAAVHPDRELIIESIESQKQNKSSQDLFAAAKDVNNIRHSTYINDDSNKNNSMANHIVVAGLLGAALLLSAAIIAKM